MDPVPTKSKKVALVTGITGQDGSYLAEFLISKGYEVHGIIRRVSTFNTERIEHIFKDVKLHHGDLLDSSNLNSIISKIKPTEIYNLAAQSHVKVSFELPEYTAECVALGTLRLLEAIRTSGMTHKTRLYQASSSEMFGNTLQKTPLTEATPLSPCSPYGCAKAFSHWIVVNYRESYGMYCTSGMLFNHESPRRGKTFVTRKITQAVANISASKQEYVSLGNLDAVRDWGHAADYVQAMWMMLQLDAPDDFCISTGEHHSVREFCEICFGFADIPIRWHGEGVKEQGINEVTGMPVVVISETYFRPCELHTLLGDCSKAKNTLGWKPTFTFHGLVYDMLKADMATVGITLSSFDECMAKLTSNAKSRHVS